MSYLHVLSAELAELFCCSWIGQQLPVDMSSLMSWETAQLVLPLLMCGLLAVCMQLCSRATSSDGRPCVQHQASRAAAARQARDDDMHDRSDHLPYRAVPCRGTDE